MYLCNSLAISGTAAGEKSAAEQRKTKGSGSSDRCGFVNGRGGMVMDLYDTMAFAGKE